MKPEFGKGNKRPTYKEGPQKNREKENRRRLEGTVRIKEILSEVRSAEKGEEKEKIIEYKDVRNS